MGSPWSPGETVLVQEIWRGRVWSARPMTVAIDRGDFVALWLPLGTEFRAATSPPTRPRAATRGERLASALDLEDWVFVSRTYDLSSLWLMEDGAAHAVWVSWRPDGSHLGWYINLQEPYRRSERGLRFMDEMLDVVVDVDRSWRWKDEDELQAMVDRGVFDEARGRATRAEGERVIRRLERNEPPFSEPWPAWRPDRSWAPPALPADWDRP